LLIYHKKYQKATKTDNLLRNINVLLFKSLFLQKAVILL